MSILPNGSIAQDIFGFAPFDIKFERNDGLKFYKSASNFDLDNVVINSYQFTFDCIDWAREEFNIRLLPVKDELWSVKLIRISTSSPINSFSFSSDNVCDSIFAAVNWLDENREKFQIKKPI